MALEGFYPGVEGPFLCISRRKLHTCTAVLNPSSMKGFKSCTSMWTTAWSTAKTLGLVSVSAETGMGCPVPGEILGTVGHLWWDAEMGVNKLSRHPLPDLPWIFSWASCRCRLGSVTVNNKFEGNFFTFGRLLLIHPLGLKIRSLLKCCCFEPHRHLFWQLFQISLLF